MSSELQERDPAFSIDSWPAGFSTHAHGGGPRPLSHVGLLLWRDGIGKATTSKPAIHTLMMMLKEGVFVFLSLNWVPPAYGVRESWHSIVQAPKVGKRLTVETGQVAAKAGPFMLPSARAMQQEGG